MDKVNTSELTLLLANMGNSDVGIGEEAKKKEEIDQIFETKGNEALKEVRAILLEPALEKIFEKGFSFIKVILFETRQSPPHRQDTYVWEDHIRQILKYRYPESVDQVFYCVPHDPSHWDLMFDFYKKSIFDLYEKFNYAYRVFVSVTGGTPAQNAALLFNAVGTWANKVKALYKPRGKPDAVDFEITTYLFQQSIGREVKALEESHNFLAAAQLGESYGILGKEKINELKAQYYRNVFDFGKALELFEQAGCEKGRQELKSLRESLETRDKCALLKELLRNMEYKLKQEEYIDFLGRLYRFTEETAKLIFEKATGISCEKGGKGFPQFEKFVKNDHELDSTFKKQELHYEPNMRTLGCVFNAIVGKKDILDKDKFMFRQGKDLLDCTRPLIELRNKTIIAHGFSGCSKEDLEMKLKSTSIENIDRLVDKLSEILKKILSES